MFNIFSKLELQAWDDIDGYLLCSASYITVA